MGWGRKKEIQGSPCQDSFHYSQILRLDSTRDFYLASFIYLVLFSPVLPTCLFASVGICLRVCVF